MLEPSLAFSATYRLITVGSISNPYFIAAEEKDGSNIALLIVLGLDFMYKKLQIRLRIEPIILICLKENQSDNLLL